MSRHDRTIAVGVLTLGIIASASSGCGGSKPKMTLIQAATAGNVAEVTKHLTSTTDLEGQDDSGTALHAAVRNNRENIVKMLLAAGADVNAKWRQGEMRTPLHVAIESGARNMVTLLLDNDADINARTQPSNKTPVHMAWEQNRRQFFEDMIRKGANPNILSDIGVSPLFIAVGREDKDLLLSLLKEGADPNQPLPDNPVFGGGTTALWYAVTKGKPELARILLDNGANPNGPSNKGWTPLHEAVGIRNAELVRLLVEHGADKNAVSSLHGRDERPTEGATTDEIRQLLQ